MSCSTKELLDVLKPSLFCSDLARQKSIKNYVWMGLYCVPLFTCPDSGVTARLLCARPKTWPSDHCARDHFAEDDFLYHDHRFDLSSYTLLGTTENASFSAVDESVSNTQGMEKRLFYKYMYTPALTPSANEWRDMTVRQRPSIVPLGQQALACTSFLTIPEFFGYCLNHRDIHRVWFHPCKRTGWYGALFFEGPTANASAVSSKVCYSPLAAATIPAAAAKFQPVPVDELDELVHDFSQVLLDA